MTKEEKLIYNYSDTLLNIVDTGRLNPVYTLLDLSRENAALSDYDITEAGQCQAYIDLVLHLNNANLAYGGYMEQRNLYKKSEHFRPGAPPERDVHLGVDLWIKAGTAVKGPLEGTIHSFNDNAGFGNYGPTIVLQHIIGGLKFYSLYGHLSRTSLETVKEGQMISAGTIFAELGNSSENGGYAPHLHFQLILDLQGYRGDYPGVCAREEIDFFQKNCPDPNLLLKI